MLVFEIVDAVTVTVVVVLVVAEYFQIPKYFFVVMVAVAEVAVGHGELLEYFVDIECALVA